MYKGSRIDFIYFRLLVFENIKKAFYRYSELSNIRATYFDSVEMTSFPAQSCCYQGFTHDGQPQGSVLMVDDFEVYTSHPPSKSTENGILM